MLARGVLFGSHTVSMGLGESDTPHTRERWFTNAVVQRLSVGMGSMLPDADVQ